MRKMILFIFLLLLVLVPTHVFAQEVELPTLEATSSPALPTEKPLEYQLPYPGLLPDNPLYSLKTLRDKIISFLVSDPIKRAEFDLLQADKRLAAGAALLERNKSKSELAESTIEKGENYFEEAIQKAHEAKLQGMEVSELARKLKMAAIKHEQVIQTLEKKSSGNLKDRFKFLEKRIDKFEKQVNQLAPQK